MKKLFLTADLHGSIIFADLDIEPSKQPSVQLIKRAWLSGRASASQAECRGFESRCPLQVLTQVI